MSNVKVPVCPTCGGRVMILCRTESPKSDMPQNYFLTCHDCRKETPKRATLRETLTAVEWLPMDAPEG
jgi:hypothetical protein